MPEFRVSKISKQQKMQKRDELQQKLQRLFTTYNKILILNIENIRTIQIVESRQLLRNIAEICVIKKTLLQRYFKSQDNEKLLPLMDNMNGNIAFLFTNGDYKTILNAFDQTKRRAVAKPGMIAPDDVVIEAQQTQLDPGQTSFFQALGIDTKINKNKIEITHSVDFIKKGDVVTHNQVVLLQKLNIVPFFYQITAKCVYDNGNIFDASVLEVDEDAMKEMFEQGLQEFVGLSLGLNVPTLPAIPHMFMNSIKEIMGFGIAAGIDKIEAVKQMIEKCN